MWYDATSAAGSLEDPTTSNVAGKIGYAYAPVEKTESSGWLWTWAWAMPKDYEERRHSREVHAVGLQQGVREARRHAARLVAGAVAASAPRPTRTRSTMKAAARLR